MRHYPSHRSPAQISAVLAARAPWYTSRVTRWLAALVVFALGFFTGAILFGSFLVISIPGGAL